MPDIEGALSMAKKLRRYQSFGSLGVPSQLKESGHTEVKLDTSSQSGVTLAAWLVLQGRMLSRVIRDGTPVFAFVLECTIAADFPQCLSVSHGG